MDAFYAIELPPQFRDMFGLPSIRAGLVNTNRTVEGPVGAQETVVPCFRGVPMGWSQALWVCQEIHEHAVQGIPRLLESNRFVDGKPLHPITREGFVHTQYVDNYIALSLDRAHVEESTNQAAAALRSRGLPRHPVEISAGGETLGWHIDADSAIIGVNPRTAWRLHFAIDAILSLGSVRGDILECLVGQFTFRALLRRELLSCLGATYAFMDRYRKVSRPLWPSVRRELGWARGLIPLACRNLAAQWSTDLIAFDASHWGVGVVSTTIDESEARELGQYSERWRFSRREEMCYAPRDDVLFTQAVEAKNLVPDLRNLVDRVKVPAVPEYIWKRSWKLVCSAPWRRPESQAILEGRAAVVSLKHLVRSENNFGKRLVMLGDALGSLLALSKGRSSAPGMLRVTRQAAALVLASACYVSYRWLPSDHNPADGASRRGLGKGHADWPPKDGTPSKPSPTLARSAANTVGDYFVGYSASETTDALDKYARPVHSCETPANGREPDTTDDRRPRPTRRSFPDRDDDRTTTYDNDNDQGNTGDPETPLAPPPPCRRDGGGALRPEGIADDGPRRHRPPTTTTKPRPPTSRPTITVRARSGGPSYGENSLGKTCDRRGHRTRLPSSLPRVRGLGPRAAPPHRLAGELGKYDACLDARSVLRGRRGVIRQHAARGHHLHARRPRPTELLPLPRPRGAERMGETRSSTEPPASALVGGGLDPRPPGVTETAPGSPRHRPHVRALLPSVGHPVPEVLRPRPADARERRVALLERGVARFENREPFQDGRIRRIGGGRQRGIRVDDHHARVPEAGEDRHGEGLRLPPRRVGKDLHDDRPRRRSQHARPPCAVPAPPRRCHPRVGDGRARSDRTHEEGSLENNVQPSAIRKRRPTKPASCSDGRSLDRPSTTPRPYYWKRPWDELPRYIKENQRPVALEIFSGSGHFSAAWRGNARAQDVAIFEWDLLHDERADLTQRGVQQKVRGWICQGWIVATWIATPCSSWSRARDRPNGPPRLRSDSFVNGLPELSAADQYKVDMGNRLAKFTASVMLLCARRGLPAVVENPASSRLWLAPGLAKLAAQSKAKSFQTDFCAYGTAWRKQTKFLAAHVNLGNVERHCCTRKLCHYTGNHVGLVGKVGNVSLPRWQKHTRGSFAEH